MSSERSPQGRAARTAILCVLVAVASGLAVAGAPSFGQIVYDPTNHVENAVSAAQAVQHTANQVRAYALQLQQYMIQVENLRRLPEATINSVLAPLRVEYDNGRALLGEVEGLGRDLADLRGRLDARLKEIGRLDVDPVHYLTYEADLARRQGKSLSAAFDADTRVLRKVNDDFLRIQALQQQLPASAGVQQSLQTLNQHLNLVAGQNAQLLSIMASHNAVADQQAVERAGTQARAADAQRQQLEQERAFVRDLRARIRESEHSSGWGVMP